MTMTVYDELVARGLVAQVTDEDELKELINAGKAKFYIGFDATADSLHVGHFMTLILIYYHFKNLSTIKIILYLYWLTNLFTISNC